jgi:hypothetical protein
MFFIIVGLSISFRVDKYPFYNSTILNLGITFYVFNYLSRFIDFRKVVEDNFL